MTDAATQIANLLYRYAETIDSGDFEGASALFTHAKVKMGDTEVGAAELRDVWRAAIILYDGVPRTKHIITNPIIEVDEAAGLGTCRSYYTVMQQVGDTPLQPVICGRYHDRFERADGVWRFCYRDYSLTDLMGDLSQHSRFWHLREG